jgi:hypothetical protein
MVSVNDCDGLKIDSHFNSRLFHCIRHQLDTDAVLRLALGTILDVKTNYYCMRSRNDVMTDMQF